MKYSNDERVDKKVRELIALGAVFEPKGRGKHRALRFPNGRKHPIIWEASDYRSALNWLSQVEKTAREGGLYGDQQA